MLISFGLNRSLAAILSQQLGPMAGLGGCLAGWLHPYRVKATSLRSAVDHVACGSQLCAVQESASVRDRFEFVFETSASVCQQVHALKYGRARFDAFHLQAILDRLVEVAARARRVQSQAHWSRPGRSKAGTSAAACGQPRWPVQMNKVLPHAFLTGILLVAGCSDSNKPAKIVQTEEFRLVDDTGQLMGQFTARAVVGGPQRPILMMYDRDGNIRVDVGLGVGATYLTLRDSLGRTRVKLATNDNASIVSLYDGNEKLVRQVRADFDRSRLVPDPNPNVRERLSNEYIPPSK